MKAKNRGGAGVKRKGANLERQIKADLEADGYLVIKSGGSLSCVDLIAIRNKDGETITRAIQIKANRMAPPAERRVLQALSKRFQSPQFYVEIAVKPDRQPVKWFLVTPEGVLDRDGTV